MKGSIKWYLRNSIKVFLTVIIYTVLMIMLFEAETTDYILSLTIFSYGIFSFSFSLSLYKLHIPLAISMGVSRKNAFVGTCFFNLFNAVFGWIFTTVMAMILEHGELAVLLGVCSVIVIFATNALGILCGILYRLFGWIAALVTGLVIYFLMAAVVMFSDFQISPLIIPAEPLLISAVVVVLIWCVMMAVHYKTVKHVAI